MRKALFLFLITSVMFIAACGSNNGANTTGSSETPSSTEESPKADTPSQKPEDTTIKLLVGTQNHNDEVAPILKEELARLGYTLEYKKPTDSIVANKEVLEGFYDAAIGMHTAALNAYNEANKSDLVPAFKTTFAPNGIYSKKYKSFEELPDGATISIPTDQANEGRPLFIMQDSGLIKLKEGIDITKATPSDIVENPHDFKFKPVDTAVLLRALDDVDAGFLYQSLRVQGGFKLEDALGIEPAESESFYIIAATRSELAGSAKLEALKQAYYTQAVKDFYATKFDEGSIYFAW